MTDSHPTRLRLIGSALLVLGIGCTTPERDSSPARDVPATPAPAPSVRPLQIGAVLPITGAGAVFAQYIKQGMDLARDEHNAGSAAKIEIAYEDSKNDPKSGISAYNKLVSVEKPPVVVVALSSVAKALSPLAASTDTTQVYIAVAIPNVTDGKRTFRLYPEANGMAGVMADYASSGLKAKTAAVVYINDDFGRASLEAFRARFGSHGGKVVFDETYQPTQADFRQQIVKLQALAKAPDIIYLNGYGPAYAAIVRQLKESGIKSQLTADMTIGLPSTRKQVGDAAEGVYYVDGKMSAEFVTKFAQKYGEEPSSYAGYAFDIVRLIASSFAEGAPVTAEVVAQGLLRARNFPGVMGDITVKPDGDSDLQFVVRRIQGGKPVPLEPIATTSTEATR